MKMKIKIKIKSYGIFRDYLKNDIEIELLNSSSLSSLKTYISNNVFVNDLNFLNNVLSKSFFSNESVILRDNHVLKNGDIVHLLPPFSGG